MCLVLMPAWEEFFFSFYSLKFSFYTCLEIWSDVFEQNPVLFFETTFGETWTVQSNMLKITHRAGCIDFYKTWILYKYI